MTNQFFKGNPLCLVNRDGRMLRCRAGISDSALVIGTGGAFEMWSPQVALQGDDPDLRALAAHLLEFQQAA